MSYYINNPKEYAETYNGVAWDSLPLEELNQIIAQKLCDISNMGFAYNSLEDVKQAEARLYPVLNAAQRELVTRKLNNMLTGVATHSSVL